MCSWESGCQRNIEAQIEPGTSIVRCRNVVSDFEDSPPLARFRKTDNFDNNVSVF